MELKNRKRVIFWVRIGLILGTIVFIFSWIGGRVSRKVEEKTDGMSVARQGPAPASLGPGDLQILTTDGNFDVSLVGDKISAGLSPKMVAQVRDEMAKETKNESGLGAVIAGAVKSGVASAIGIHVSWDLKTVKEVVYEDGKLKIIDKDGDTHGLSGDSKDNDKGSKEKAVFSKADAERFIAAVNKRKAELGLP
jgi:hypothetical protein